MSAGHEVQPWIVGYLRMLCDQGLTAEEAVDEIARSVSRPPSLGFSMHDRRLVTDAAAEIWREAGKPAPPESKQRPVGPEWVATVRAYRRVLAKDPTRVPTQERVAGERQPPISEKTLAGRLRKLGIDDWHDVPALVESEPDDARLRLPSG